MTIQHTVTGDFFDGIRAAFFTDAEPEAEPVVTADDIPLDAWATRRGELGLGGKDTDFIGIDDEVSASGMPDWRHPAYEEVVISAMDHYADEREELGIKTASAVFGAAPAQPRTHSSPYSI